jgi:hypothetical protein
MAKKNSGKPQEQQINTSSSAGKAAQMSNGNANQRMNEPMGGGDGRDGGLSNDEIATRAYEIYEREGRSDGRDMEHWLRAESELRTERQQPQSSPRSRQDLPRSARQYQPATAV